MSPCPSDESLKSLGTDAKLRGNCRIRSDREGDRVGIAHNARRPWSGSSAGPGFAHPPSQPRNSGRKYRVSDPARAGPRELSSVVYQAWQPRLKRHVALKMRSERPGLWFASKTAGCKAQAYSCVRHPNIVPLHEAGEAGPWLYLVLEYMPGGSLKHRLDIPYAARDAARLLEAIERASRQSTPKGWCISTSSLPDIMLDLEPGQPREGQFPGSVISASPCAGATARPAWRRKACPGRWEHLRTWLRSR